MVLDPEVLWEWYKDHVMEGRCCTYNTAAKPGPRIWTRVVCVAIREASVSSPHDLLEFPELGKEAGDVVVYSRRVFGD